MAAIITGVDQTRLRSGMSPVWVAAAPLLVERQELAAQVATEVGRNLLVAIAVASTAGSVGVIKNQL